MEIPSSKKTHFATRSLCDLRCRSGDDPVAKMVRVVTRSKSRMKLSISTSVVCGIS